MTILRARRRVLFSIVVLGAAAPAMAAVHIGPTCAYTSIQAAIDANPQETTFRIDAGTYAEHVVLAHAPSALMRIEGGYHDCQGGATNDAALTTVSAAGTNRSVFAFSGAFDVQLVNVTMTGGSDIGGGGIQAAGHGRLVLGYVHVTGNAADYGGGIQGLGVDGPLEIALGADVLVSGNTASKRGGGVFVSGNTRLYMNGQNAIAYNTMLGEDDEDGGGGLAIVGPARADIGSGGFFDAAAGVRYGTISHNVAHRGAGIDVRAGGTVRLYSIDAAHPLAISQNRKPDTGTLNSRGAGIFAADAGSQVCAWNVGIEGNSAEFGAAISSMGARVDLMRGLAFEGCGPEPATAFGAKECQVGRPCNRINDNVSDGVIELIAPAEWTAEQIEIRRNGNAAWYQTLIHSSANHIALQNCLIADNRPGTLISWLSPLVIDGCTIARNGIGTQTGYVFEPFTGAQLVLAHSIVTTAPGVDLFARPPPTMMSVTDVIASDSSQLVTATHEGVTMDDPQFVDAGHGDYHPKRTSPAIDYAVAGQALDADGLPRGRADTPEGAARPYDIGAFEPDIVFANGFD